MKIEIHPQETMTLEEFSKKHDLTMAVYERDITVANPLKKYFCYFKHVEIKDGPILKSTSGNGNTVNEAIEDYCKELSKKRIVIRASDSEHRTVFFTPVITPHWETE